MGYFSPDAFQRGLGASAPPAVQALASKNYVPTQQQASGFAARSYTGAAAGNITGDIILGTAAIGASYGSVVPVIGTIIGGAVGAAIGALQLQGGSSHASRQAQYSSAWTGVKTSVMLGLNGIKPRADSLERTLTAGTNQLAALQKQMTNNNDPAAGAALATLTSAVNNLQNDYNAVEAVVNDIVAQSNTAAQGEADGQNGAGSKAQLALQAAQDDLAKVNTLLTKAAPDAGQVMSAGAGRWRHRL